MPTFKIRRKSDGLFSRGGTDPRFNRIGKSWTNEQTFRSHLTMVGQGVSYPATPQKMQKRIEQVYAGCEVVRYEMVETQTRIEVPQYELLRRQIGKES